MQRRLFLITLGLAVAAACGVAAPRSTAAPGSPAERVRSAVRRTAHRSFRYSVGVWDATTGDGLFAQNAGVMRRTASVMKLATTGAALLALGPAHEMYVEVRGARAPVDGVLAGNLMVEGTGDPGLSSHLTEGGAGAAVGALARAVRASGVRRVEGDLILDTSAFSGPDRHPDWGWTKEQYDWYMAPVTAITVNDACVDLLALPGAAAGAPARLEIGPPGVRTPLVNALSTTAVRKEHRIVLAPPDAGGRIRVSGKVLLGSQGYSTAVACVDPPVMFGQVFLYALRAAGVTVGGEVRIVRGPPAATWPRAANRSGVVLARHASSLEDVIGVTNRRSQNLWAELVLRNLGLYEERDGSFEGGCRAVRRILELGDDFAQEDGSGLSRADRATVGAIGSVLLRLYRSEQRLVFMSSLAKGGDPEGTLRRRFREARFAGRVRAKTGTLHDTKALAGFVRGKSGRVYAFVVLCEGVNWRAQKMQDAVVGALVDG